MDHPTLILGELRGFKEEALRRLSGLETGMASLQRKEDRRTGKAAAYAAMGAMVGVAINFLAGYLWR